MTDLELLVSLFEKTSRDPAFVYKGTECLLWDGKLNEGGYGVTGRNQTGTKLVHRVIFQIFNGPVPRHLDLDHLCRVRRCCSHFHLEPVTRRVNLLRGIGMPAINIASLACPRGHPYSGSNNRGDRLCHICYAETARKSRSRKTGFASLGPRAERTTCPSGHPYTGVDPKGFRFCRVCKTDQHRRWLNKKLEAAK